MEDKESNLYRFSIIMATYNDEEFIGRAIKSILAQDYKNFELIIVDDGSTDNTKNVVSEYIDKTGVSISYLYQKNMKQGSARNHGLRYAQGEYIIFVDSDDELVEDILVLLDREVNRVDSPDLIFYGYEHVNAVGVSQRSFPVNSSAVEAINSDSFEKFKIPLTPCAHTANRQFLIENNITFLEQVFFEDIDYMLTLVSVARKSSSISAVGYRYYIYPNSTVRGGAASRNLDVIASFEALKHKFISKGMYTDALEFCAVQYLLIDASIRVICSSSPRTERRRCFGIIRAYMEENFSEYRKNPYLKSIGFAKRMIMKLINLNLYSLLDVSIRMIAK